MELKDVLGGIAYRGAGCLFYTIDSDGDIWVLLGRRPAGHLFGSAYRWSIPEAAVKDDDPSIGGSEPYYEASVNYLTNNVSVVYDQTHAGAPATQDGVKTAVALELAERNYVVSNWNDASGVAFGSGRDIYVSDQTGRIQVFHVVLTTK